jgi:hypothetical protein
MEDFERDQFEKHLERYTHGVTAGSLRDTWATWSARACAILCLALITYRWTANSMPRLSTARAQ